MISHVARGEQVGLGLAAHDDARGAVLHGDDRGTAEVVVVAGERPAVCAGGGDGDEVARLHVGGQVVGAHDDVAALAVLAGDAHEGGSGIRRPVGEPHRVVGLVQRGPDVVAHAAVDADVLAHRGRLAGRRACRDHHVFHRADLVERDGRRPDDRAARLDRDHRNRDAERRALGGDDPRELPRDRRDRSHLVGARVRDAEAAAEVELGHLSPGQQLGVHDQQPPRGLGESVGLEDLRADVRVQAEEAQARMRADLRDDLRRVGERDAELLVLVRGRQELVGRGVHAAVDAQPHRLHAPVPLGRGGDTVDLDDAVQDDRAHTDFDTTVDLGEALVVAVESEAGRVDAGRQRDGQLSPAAHVDVETGGGHPARDLGAQEGLARVVDVRGRSDRRRTLVERGLDLGGRDRGRPPRRRRRAGVPNSAASAVAIAPAS